jgi:glycosyltransferase involved in cell wall biosynthesis
MKPTFSIILPTYNRAYILWKAVQSVLAQRFRDWELIIVDDGSTDCTQRLIEEFRDTRVATRKTPNGGPSAARNTGLSLAKGEYIAYLDSDNTWHVDFLERMLASIERSPEAVLWYCGQISTFWERTGDGRWKKQSEAVHPRAQYHLGDVWGLKGADTSCIVHRESILARTGGWDEKCAWLEDWDFFLRVFLHSTLTG